MIIGKKIQKLRKKQNLTQEELAIKSNTSYTTLIKIESGQVKNPTINTIQKIAEALDVTIDDLVIKKSK